MYSLAMMIIIVFYYSLQGAWPSPGPFRNVMRALKINATVAKRL